MKNIFLISCLLFCISSYGQSYYGYQERGTEGVVGWDQIGVDISNKLKEAEREREAKLKESGWSSEYEYHQYRQSLKQSSKQRKYELKEEKNQLKLMQRYMNGDKNIFVVKGLNGNSYYYKR